MTIRMDLSQITTTFRNYLQDQGIQHAIDIHTGKLVVHDSLHLHSFGIPAMPEGMTVQEDVNISKQHFSMLPDNLTVMRSMALSDTCVQVLPKGLTVHQDLFLRHAPIQEIPHDLRVGRHILLDYSKVTSLPENFRVHGQLNISHTPLTSLPMGLTVGGALDLTDTPISTLPEDLSVGFILFPTTRLDDIRRFCARQGQAETTFDFMDSHHARMHMHERLLDFPDIWTVVCTLPPGEALVLRTQPWGAVEAIFRKIHS